MPRKRKPDLRKWSDRTPEYRQKNNAGRPYRRDKRRDCKFESLLHGVERRCDYNPWYQERGIRCFLTAEDIRLRWNQDGAGKMNAPELDRIDPTGHYSRDNIQFIEKAENLARRTFQGKL